MLCPCVCTQVGSVPEPCLHMCIHRIYTERARARVCVCVCVHRWGLYLNPAYFFTYYLVLFCNNVCCGALFRYA